MKGALKLTRATVVSMETVAGVADKLTDKPVYVAARKELLSAALPGRTPRLAPRYPAAFLAALEEWVIKGTSSIFFKILNWWLLFQSW